MSVLESIASLSRFAPPPLTCYPKVYYDTSPHMRGGAIIYVQIVFLVDIVDRVDVCDVANTVTIRVKVVLVIAVAAVEVLVKIIGVAGCNR